MHFFNQKGVFFHFFSHKKHMLLYSLETVLVISYIFSPCSHILWVLRSILQGCFYRVPLMSTWNIFLWRKKKKMFIWILNLSRTKEFQTFSFFSFLITFTIIDLITAHAPISTQLSYLVVFRLQPVYFYQLHYENLCCLYSCELPRQVKAIQMSTYNISFNKDKRAIMAL